MNLKKKEKPTKPEIKSLQGVDVFPVEPIWNNLQIMAWVWEFATTGYFVKKREGQKLLGICVRLFVSYYILNTTKVSTIIFSVGALFLLIQTG